MPVDTRGVYITLLCYQWVNGYVPKDEHDLARICAVSHDEITKHLLYLDDKYIDNPERKGTRVNPRMERERQKQHAFRESRAKAGRASGRKRANKRRTKSNSSSSSSSSSSSLSSKTQRSPAGTGREHPFGDDAVEQSKYPDGLNVDAWDKYVEHRRDIKAKKLTPKGAAQAMKKWAKTSPEAQMRAVEAGIANGWTGCFPEKEMPGRGKETPMQKLNREMDEQNAHK